MKHTITVSDNETALPLYLPIRSPFFVKLNLKVFYYFNHLTSALMFETWAENLNKLLKENVSFFSFFVFLESPSLYENNHYHEECLKCNSCGMNLSGPNQKRARRYKNQVCLLLIIECLGTFENIYVILTFVLWLVQSKPTHWRFVR